MKYYVVLVAHLLLLFSMCITQEQENAPPIMPMEKQERESLYSALQGFVGEPWNGYELYPDPCGWTPIQGVGCDIMDGHWYVTVLSIGSVLQYSLQCGETAEFPRQLFQLKHLKSLSIVSCFNSIENPTKLPSTEWQAISDTLEMLDLRSNPGLVGTIPAGIGFLRRLQSLVLHESGVSGEIPMELGNLTNLKRLILAGNRLRGEIPPSIGGLSKLLILDASGNLLSGQIPSSIQGLMSALKVDLSSNKLGGAIPNVWGNLKDLGLLDLGNNNLSGGLTNSFESLSSLNALRVSNNPMMGGDLMGVKWEMLENLELLDLSNCGLRGGISEGIAKMKRLRYLDISNNNLTGEVSKMFGERSNLGSLFLNGNNLSGRLEFKGSFYGRMGHRLRLWSNAMLCYLHDHVSLNGPPHGLSACKQ